MTARVGIARKLQRNESRTAWIAFRDRFGKQGSLSVMDGFGDFAISGTVSTP